MQFKDPNCFRNKTLKETKNVKIETCIARDFQLFCQKAKKYSICKPVNNDTCWHEMFPRWPHILP